MPSADHEARLERARLALDGLSVGDAFGGQFFIPEVARGVLPVRGLPPGSWSYTDDTEQAFAVFEVLQRHGRIDQDDLAAVLARRYMADQYRGYGITAHETLPAIAQGAPWRQVAYAPFDGQGSMGNGSAMRVALVGAYFADDLDRVAAEAGASAEVTHPHPEGVAGAVAVAVAAALACRGQREGFLAAVLERTPESATRRGLVRATELHDAEVDYAAYELGNGSRVTAPDTVPFCLWCAARHLDDYAAALWTTVSGYGDVDTTGAIVGGVVVLSAGRDSIPEAWLRARETLDFLGGRNPIRGRL
jgi:ADP-ribosylglycohydrolase